MERKYKLTDDCIQYEGHKLYRIQSLRSFSNVKEGELGGYIESEDNLSHDGMCWVYEEAKVFGNAKVYKNGDYIVFKNWWSSGRYFTWTRSNNKWKVGCFCGTGAELINKAYEDSELSGREYERVVKYVESIIADNN